MFKRKTIWDKKNLRKKIIFKIKNTLKQFFFENIFKRQWKLRQLTIKTKSYQFKTILSNSCKIDFDSVP